MRLFISIEIPENIKDRIIEVRKQLPKFEGKVIEKENLHLTLKFLGEVDENQIEEITNKLDQIKFNSFNAEIDSIGFFDNRNSKIYPKRMIVWLGVRNCEILQKEIDEKLKEFFEPEERFMSHLTIARVKNVNNKKEFTERLYKINIPPMNFYVNNFSLKESMLTPKGSIYKTLESYNLN